MRLRYRNTLHFFLLLIFLGGPFVLRIVDYRFEIYPSVVLPAGAKKLDLNKEIRISVNEIYGETGEGSLKNLDNAHFLRPIRVEYLSYFYEANFGLDTPKTYEFTTNRFAIPITLKSKKSLEDIKATKIWLRQRLREQGCKDSVLILKKRIMIVCKDGTFYEDNNILNDTILGLY
ncbi:hypothetical protein [Spongiimicrobium salis]|uniref:hypothetical protein n=1 Tax=Spongiimicrobium salis TaxID=1667022 RepID=UPI00374DED6B